VLDLRNDVGLLAEGYDPATGRHLGNMPQAFSLLALVNTARHIAGSTTRTLGLGSGAANRTRAT
jgi:GH15 family glucan-1,4-alpha-glucosidase